MFNFIVSEQHSDLLNVSADLWTWRLQICLNLFEFDLFNARRRIYVVP